MKPVHNFKYFWLFYQKCVWFCRITVWSFKILFFYLFIAQGFSISVKLVLWNANKNVKFTESFVRLAELEYIFTRHYQELGY